MKRFLFFPACLLLLGGCAHSSTSPFMPPGYAYANDLYKAPPERMRSTPARPAQSQKQTQAQTQKVLSGKAWND